MVVHWFHPQSSLRAGNVSCDAYDTPGCMCVGSLWILVVLVLQVFIKKVVARF